MVTSWSLGCSRLDVCRRFDRSFILSRHSEFDKNETNSGNMKMEGSGPQCFVNTARFDCTCTLLLLPDELSGPDSAGVETKSFRLMVAKSLQPFWLKFQNVRSKVRVHLLMSSSNVVIAIACTALASSVQILFGNSGPIPACPTCPTCPSFPGAALTALPCDKTGYTCILGRLWRH